MTPHEKARETRQRNAERRKQWEAQHREAKEKDRPIVIEALRAILTDPAATPSERVFALTTLDDMQSYGFIPLRVKYAETANLTTIKEEVEAVQAAQGDSV